MKHTLNKSFLFLFLFLVLNTFALAQTAQENAIQLYEKGDYKTAIEVFEKIVKENPADAEAQSYLSLSLAKTGRLREAEIALGKTLALDSSQVKARKALAQIFLVRGKSTEAARQASYIISLDARDAEIYYILGLANLRLGKSDEALENAEQSLKYDDKFAVSNLLKAQAFMSRKTEPTDYAAISAKFRAAADSLDNFIQLLNDTNDLSFWRQQRESLKYFINYYDEKQKTSVDLKDNKIQTSTPIKILTKRSTTYTDEARNAGLSGSISLLVAFADNGAVSHVLALNNLGYRLDEAAVKTAKEIKFEPEIHDGKAVTTVKMIQYSFTLY
jgi:TonB family protein